MKTSTKKKAVKFKKVKGEKVGKLGKANIDSPIVNLASAFPKQLYELYRTKSGSWKFRKRARNGEILNHSYNSKALAIKGMKADFRLTKEMSELKWKEVGK